MASKSKKKQKATKKAPTKKATRAVKANAKAKPKAKPKAQANAKPKAKRKAPARAGKKKAAAPKARPRRDATGDLDPAYAKGLRRLSRANVEHDDDRAFLVGERADDALAQELGTEFVETVTSGEDEGVELRDAAVPEDEGGPFVPTTGAKEFADEPDASNPADATREPFPKT